MTRATAPSSNGNEPTSELDVPTGPFAQPEPIPPDRLKRGRAAHRRYFLWMRLGRLAFAAFLFMTVIVLLWLVPWLPSGLDTNGYTPRVAFTIYLLAGSAITALLVLSLQELARRDRQVLTAWASVYDEATGLHTRTYFNDRLALECDRAQQTPEPFSVIVLQFHALGSQPKRKNKPPLSNTALEKTADLINTITHASDEVGLLSGSELAVLAVRVDRAQRHVLQERLQRTVAAALPDLVGQQASIDVRSGGATYGVDGTQPGGLIQAARTSAALSVRKHVKAA
jgi:GGDEF domain-containing protein